MKKSKYFIVILILIVLLGLIFYINFRNDNSGSNSSYPSGRRLLSSNDINNTNSININETTENSESNSQNIIKANTLFQTQLSTFQTKILDNSSGRLTNIKITCSIIDGQIIKSGEEFSFNSTVGKPSADRGYQLAKVIIDGHSEQGIGGGNCQVSSTLYNAVLATPNLVILERHEHGKSVGYVPKGQDAAVSYDSIDFKFRNNNDYDIKINISSDDSIITASIYK